MNSASDERLDQLAAKLNTVVTSLESGVPVVALKDQLVKLHKACLDVVKDADLEPTSDIQRDVVRPARAKVTIPRPFQPVDLSRYRTSA